MSFCLNYIDTSISSVTLGLVSIVILFLAVQYYFNSYVNHNVEEPYSERQVNVISALISLLFTYVVLVFYKQYLEYQGTKCIDSTSFYS